MIFLYYLSQSIMLPNWMVHTALLYSAYRKALWCIELYDIVHFGIS
jgi:hypothetical protein